MVVCIFSLLLVSCNKCEDFVQVFGDLVLQESALALVGILEIEELRFVDSSGRNFILTRSDFESKFSRISSGRVVCESEGVSEGYYLGENRSSKYDGEEFDLIISFKALSDDLARSEDEINLNKTTGLDFMEVEVIFNQCDTLRSLRPVQNELTGEPNIRFNPIPFKKFNQEHPNSFRLQSFSYPGDMAFTMEKGLIAFDYCGFNLVQLGN